MKIKYIKAWDGALPGQTERCLWLSFCLETRHVHICRYKNSEKQLLTESFSWKTCVSLFVLIYESLLYSWSFIYMTETNTLTVGARKEAPQIRFSAILSLWHRIKMNWKRPRGRCEIHDYVQCFVPKQRKPGERINCNSWVSRKWCRQEMKVSN